MQCRIPERPVSGRECRERRSRVTAAMRMAAAARAVAGDGAGVSALPGGAKSWEACGWV